MRLHRFALCSFALLLLLSASRRQAPGEPVEPVAKATPARTFDGPSTGLRSTTVVPGFRTPLPARGNVVWCSTVEMAWRKVGRMMGGALDVPGGGDEAARLSAAVPSGLPDQAFYADGGRATEALFDRIERTMRQRFGQPPKFDLRRVSGTWLAYAFLRAEVAFSTPYGPITEGILFRGTGDRATRVSAFGSTRNSPRAVRAQMRVLYVQEIPDYGAAPTWSDFVLDLDGDSAPFQVLVAVVPRRETLEAIWADVQKRIEGARPMDPNSHVYVAVPTTHWRILHAFTSLQGPHMGIENPGFESQWVSDLRQIVTFRLDQRGAVVESEAASVTRGEGPLEFVVNRPYLVALRTRGHDRPFFALWIENTELLVRQPER